MPCTTDVGGAPEITGARFATVAHQDRERREVGGRPTVADTNHDVAGRPDVACRRRALQSARRRAERRPRGTVRERERQRIAVRDRSRSVETSTPCPASPTSGACPRSPARGSSEPVAHGDRERRQLRRGQTVADRDQDVAIASYVGARRRSRKTTRGRVERGPARTIRDAVCQRIAVRIRRRRRKCVRDADRRRRRRRSCDRRGSIGGRRVVPPALKLTFENAAVASEPSRWLVTASPA